MTKLEFYDWEKVGHEDRRKGLPIHSEWRPTENIIYIRSNDPRLSPHVTLSHEIAHWKDPIGVGTNLGNELNAWEEAIYNLMRAGEWTPEAREQVAWALKSYVEEYSMNVEDVDKETRWWIVRLEGRARRRLKNG